MPYGIAHQPVVAGYIQGNERLNAGIANVLQLFIVRTIKIIFPGAKPGGAPAGFPYFTKRRIAAGKFSFFNKWISCKYAIQVMNDQRFCGSFYFQLYIAPGAQPQGAEQAVFPAIRDKHIIKPKNFSLGDVITIAFVVIFIEQGFGIKDGQLASLTFTDHNFRVTNR